MSDIAMFRLVDLAIQQPGMYVLLLSQENGAVRAVSCDRLVFDERIGAYTAVHEDGCVAVTFSSDVTFQMYPAAYIESMTQGELMEEQFATAHAEKVFRDRAQRMMEESR